MLKAGDDTQGLNRLPVLPTGNLEIEASYSESPIRRAVLTHDAAHIHSVCEMYFNLSGKVSFAVENKVYPVAAGDLIITKPNEIHYCIYNEDGLHRCYCLGIRADDAWGYLLAPFFERAAGENNLISLNVEQRRQMAALLDRIVASQKEGRCSTVACAAAVMSVLEMLEQHKSDTRSSVELPAVLQNILSYIDEHYTERCAVENLCRRFFTSRSTMDRMFRQYLHTTPSRYLENRRLAHAKQLLENGASVQDACEQGGFPDYSHFIALFKRRFGITPLQYRKNCG